MARRVFLFGLFLLAALVIADVAPPHAGTATAVTKEQEQHTHHTHDQHTSSPPAANTAGAPHAPQSNSAHDPARSQGTAEGERGAAPLQPHSSSPHVSPSSSSDPPRQPPHVNPPTSFTAPAPHEHAGETPNDAAPPHTPPFSAPVEDPSLLPSAGEQASSPRIVSEAESLYIQAQQAFEEGSIDNHDELIVKAAEMDHPAARNTLAFMSIFGNSTVVAVNHTRALELFEANAALGYAPSQWGLAFLYAAGVGVNASQARALVYMTFAAMGGVPEAQMALGYRYLAGWTVPTSCEKAVYFYRSVADHVAADASTLSSTMIERKRLSDRVLSTSDDLINYYQLNAERGDVQAQLTMGQVHLHGAHGQPVNPNQAMRMFRWAAAQNDPHAMAFMGSMYASGVGVDQNNDTAKDWLEKSAARGSAIGQNGLGLLYLHGQGVTRDYTKALELFTKAATAGNADAQYYLGTLYHDGLGTRRDYHKAMSYFSLATQQSHLLGIYSLATMHATGTGTSRSCDMAASMFKIVAERGSWGLLFHQALQNYEDFESSEAIVKYLYLAEMGYEQAQYNAAYLLEADDHVDGQALWSWRRSAKQGHSSSHVRIGDYHYYGWATSADPAAAASEYRAAADTNNAQGMFNLGWMYEHGEGLDRDLHLAKRYYDLAMATAHEAQLAAGMALVSVRAKMLLETLHSGQVLEWFGNVDTQWQVPEIPSFDELDKMIEGYEVVLATALLGLLAILLLARRLVIPPQ